MAEAAHLANVLAKLDDDVLRAQAEQVAQLVQQPGWQHLSDLIETVRGTVTARLEGSGFAGQILEQAEYARLMGFLAGLRQPQLAADTFAAQLEKLRKRNLESPE